MHSPYLRSRCGKVQERLHRLRLHITYRVWRERLQRWAAYDVRSHISILDAGCGPGYLLACLQNWYPLADLTGLDLDSALLYAAQRRAPKANFVQQTVEELSFEPHSFNVVFCLQVLEHLANPEAFLFEAHRVLRPNGILVVATPNPTGLCARWHGKHWHSYRLDHISLRPPDAWRHSLAQFGFRVLEDGTTLLTGCNLIRRTPLMLLNWGLLAMLGFFHWELGESYMAIAAREQTW